MDNTFKANKIFTNFIISIVIALIATATSYNYWHDTNIRVTFHADNDKDINYQLFYMDENSKWFNEPQSVKQIVEAGSSSVKIVLPTENVTRVRLDFGQIPNKVTIKNFKISGNKTIEFTDFDKYNYNQINSHTTNKDGSLTIISDKKDPYMITTEKLDIHPADDYNWLRMGLIAGGSFIVAFLLAMLINRKRNK